MSHAIVMTKQYKPFLNNAIQKHEKHKHQMDREITKNKSYIFVYTLIPRTSNIEKKYHAVYL